jgi:hypothetical protein
MSDPEVFMSGAFDAAFLLKKVKKSLKKILTGRGACCILLCIVNASNINWFAFDL